MALPTQEPPHHSFETVPRGPTKETLEGLTPYKFICKQWTSELDRFIIDPIHQMPGLNS